MTLAIGYYWPLIVLISFQSNKSRDFSIVNFFFKQIKRPGNNKLRIEDSTKEYFLRTNSFKYWLLELKTFLLFSITIQFNYYCMLGPVDLFMWFIKYNFWFFLIKCMKIKLKLQVNFVICVLFPLQFLKIGLKRPKFNWN